MRIEFPIATGEITEPPSQATLKVRKSRIQWKDKAGGPGGESNTPRGVQLQNSEEAIQSNTVETVEDSKSSPNTNTSPDYWTTSGEVLVRHHVTPRTELYSPTEDDACPVPLKYLDVTRETRTSSEIPDEGIIKDIWDPDESIQRKLFQEWTGTTTLDILKERPPNGYTWCNGRLPRLQQTTRPDYIWPENWQSLSKGQQQKEIAKSIPYIQHREKVREKRGVRFIPENELPEWKTQLQEIRNKFSVPPAPAMPLLPNNEQRTDRDTTYVAAGRNTTMNRNVQHLTHTLQMNRNVQYTENA